LRDPSTPTLFPYTTLFRSFSPAGAHYLSAAAPPAFRGSHPDKRRNCLPASNYGFVRPPASRRLWQSPVQSSPTVLCTTPVPSHEDRNSTRLNSSHVKISYA